MTADPATTLCLACGLCCDGNLFTQVPLRSEEVAPLARRGLTIVARSDGGAALRQRCGALVGRCCDIYEERPATCRSYRCMLLTALVEGDVDVREALEIVARAHGLLAAVDREGVAGERAVMQRARQEIRDDTATPGAREATAAAAGHLGRHFQRDVDR